MSDLVVARLDKARALVPLARTIPEAKSYGDTAEAIRIWAKRSKAGIPLINRTTAIKLLSERRVGQLLKTSPKHSGSKNQLKGRGVIGPAQKEGPIIPTRAEMGLTWKESSRSQKLADVSDSLFDAKLKEAESATTEVHTTGFIREIVRHSTHQHNGKLRRLKPSVPAGTFHVLVVDPPWPIQKIERDCRENQAGLDYPTMTLDQLSAWNLPTKKAAPNCHLFLWTTQKWLPESFPLLAKWGFQYVLCMVWHKPGGFQPYGLPQYNCEFCLYARKGSPKFVDTKAFPTCFSAPRGKHSEKPASFYDLIRRVTDGPRLDMFNRKSIDGFETFGYEAAPAT